MMPYNLYWGDIHVHTSYSDGVGTPESNLNIAKDQSLDFCAITDHEDTVEQHQWKRTQEVIAEYNNPNKFITFLGFEWNGSRSGGGKRWKWCHGDWIVYYLNDNEPLLSYPEFKQVKKYIKKRHGQAILIPHHSAYKVGRRGINWVDCDTDITPFVEIFSMHGSSEGERAPLPIRFPTMGTRESGGAVECALARGLKLGLIASSDGHEGYPGGYKKGLMAVYATELTREALWDAFFKRRIYAVTGDRIKVDFRINGKWMGEEISADKAREIEVQVIGNDVISKIEIIKNGRLLHMYHDDYTSPRIPEDSKNHIKFRLEWGWGKKGREITWNGKLSLGNGEILSIEPCFSSPPPNRIIKHTKKLCKWISHTNGHGGRYDREPTNSIVFEIRARYNDSINIVLDSFRKKTNIKKLFMGSEVIFIDRETVKVRLAKDSPKEYLTVPKGDKIKIHQAVLPEQYKKNIQIVDKKPELDIDYYYVRVTQANGQMAWSSPIWVRK